MTTTALKPQVAGERERFYSDLEAESMRALWKVMGGFVLPEPNSPARPAVWEFEHIRPLINRSGDLISAEEAERRVLILENPGLSGSSLITRTLYCGIQLIKPGEIAGAHRHTQNALRFVLEGEGGYTAVDGEKVYMHPFDLILTPNWAWHDHANEVDGEMIWLDGLDLGMVQLFDGAFSDQLQDEKQHPESRPAGDTLARYGHNMAPIGQNHIAGSDGARPLIHYPYAQWRETLDAMPRAGDPDPHFGYKFEFINPLDGSAVMQTISAFVQLVPAGMTTSKAQVTDGTVYTIAEGEGTATVGDQSFKLKPLSTFVVPAWVPLELSASSDLVLFSYSDRVAQKALGLWREKLAD